MAEPTVWTFRQLGGEGKILQVAGYAAPFGRPRKDPVVKELIKLRVQTTRYPGSKDSPTRHGFGSGWEPMELKGRWMTRHLLESSQTAESMADDWTSFVRDEQTIRMSWGNIVSYTGIIEELELGRESPDEIAWRMTVLVDKRDDAPHVIVSTTTESLIDVDGLVSSVNKLERPELPEMSLSPAEALDFLFGQLKQYTGFLSDIANQFNSIEKATFSSIQSFRGIIANFESALVTMKDVVMNTEIDAIMAVRRAESDIAWYKYQLEFDVESLFLSSILADIERTLELQTKTHVNRQVVAIDNDDWEKLSTRATGGPEHASAIREANGIRYGQLPDPGNTYLIP